MDPAMCVPYFVSPSVVPGELFVGPLMWISKMDVFTAFTVFTFHTRETEVNSFLRCGREDVREMA